MKIIKEFDSRDMKHIQYDCNDAEELKKQFVAIDKETIERLCNWLKENNSVVDVIDCFDSQSGWQGEDFFIGKANLSLNGYCLTTKQIEAFLNNEKVPSWYCFYQEEYEEAVEWQNKNK